MANQRGDRDVYSQRDSPAFETWMPTRKAAREAALGYLSTVNRGTRSLKSGATP